MYQVNLQSWSQLESQDHIIYSLHSNCILTPFFIEMSVGIAWKMQTTPTFFLRHTWLHLHRVMVVVLPTLNYYCILSYDCVGLVVIYLYLGIKHYCLCCSVDFLISNNGNMVVVLSEFDWFMNIQIQDQEYNAKKQLSFSLTDFALVFL